MNSQATPRLFFTDILKKDQPQAVAWVRGGSEAPQLTGLIKFFNTPYGGVLVEAEVFGLPNINTPNSSDFYAMHIHESGDCSDNFSRTGEHYNPVNTLHPYHAGDMPPLLGNQGYAWSSFYTKRFQIPDVIGRSVIIHSHADDFTSQPAGNSGDKIACGTITQMS